MSMDIQADPNVGVARIAAAIGEPARARMLFCLLDNRARSSTELALVADVSPSTASVHLHRLRADGLLNVLVQGKHRYYSLGGRDVARALEGLSLLASGPSERAAVPAHLRAARTCYDHLAGLLGVALHDRLMDLGWIAGVAAGGREAYDLTPTGTRGLEALGVDVVGARERRRRFAFPCVDWSERRPHLGGALGAVLLEAALKKRWLVRERDSRAVSVTGTGRREMLGRLGLSTPRD